MTTLQYFILINFENLNIYLILFSLHIDNNNHYNLIKI